MGEASNNWQSTGYGCARLVDGTGKVIGRVHTNMASRETCAEAVGIGGLGNYDTETNAKAAVERALINRAYQP